MEKAQRIKGKAFKDLHSRAGMFGMPNAWNAGSACMLEAAGFPALGTTSRDSILVTSRRRLILP